MFLSVVTVNSKWEILTNNLLLLKDKVWLRMKNFLGLIEKSDFQEGRGLMKNQYKGGVGELPKKGGLNSLLIYEDGDLGQK